MSSSKAFYYTSLLVTTSAGWMAAGSAAVATSMASVPPRPDVDELPAKHPALMDSEKAGREMIAPPVSSPEVLPHPTRELAAGGMAAEQPRTIAVTEIGSTTPAVAATAEALGQFEGLRPTSPSRSPAFTTRERIAATAPPPTLERSPVQPQLGTRHPLPLEVAPAVSEARVPQFSQRAPATDDENASPAPAELDEPRTAPAIAPETPATTPGFSDGMVPSMEAPETGEEAESDRDSSDLEESYDAEIAPIMPADFTVFPVGINVDSRNVIETTLVKGFFDGEAAVAFEDWLLPFDDVMQALRFQVTPLENGELELRSPGAILRLNPAELRTDPDLGLVLSVTDVEQRLNVPTEFDRLDYAVEFSPPWGRSNRQNRQREERPILTEGLPMVSPVGFRITGVAQEFTASGSPDRGTEDSRGSFSAIGGAFGGSWFVDINQPTPGDFDTWSLQEFQYLRQSPAADVALGSQPTFWRSQRSGSNDFWGVGYVQRWGFEPEVPTGAGGFDPRERLQADVVGRSIVGEAEPGTLVQLTTGFSNLVVDEKLVDSSGLYRFDDVPTGGGGGNRYEVRLFPDGQLTATPEVLPATFSVLAGHLPVGASALAVSGGLNRESDGFLGSFNEFRGGATYRYGLTEALTLGAGLVQDETTQALTEAFFVNDALFPIRASVSALVDLPTGELDLNADLRLQPSPSTQVNFRHDRFSTRLDTSWTVSRNFTLTANADTRDEAVELGTRFSFSGNNFYVFGNASIDTKSRLQWNLNSRLGAFGLRHFGNDITTQTQLFYSLSGDRAYGDGHAVLMDYETRDVDGDTNHLGTLSWRYRSEQRSVYGRPLWDIQVGYAIGSEGEGPVAAITSGILPGVDLSLRYQAVSATSGQDSFRLEISPRLNFQNGVTFANERQEWLRTQGGLLIEPFLDRDGDGFRDADEPIYNDPEDLNLLLAINHQTLNRFRPDIREEGVFVTLPPGMYRVDLDSAGYPLDWTPSETAFAAETRPGQYTHLEIPLQASYTVMGVVTDETGAPLGGQRVEATPEESGQRVLSITNAAGVFYLEGLKQGTYTFSVHDSFVDNFSLTFEQDSETFQELNFTVTDDGQTISNRREF